MKRNIRYIMEFKRGPGMSPEHEKLEVRQVYVWAQTADGKIVVVSKDGEKWQLPGGKPQKHHNTPETHEQTAIREACEEASLKIAPDFRPGFFGYYVVKVVDGDTDEQIEEYAQVRLGVLLKESSDQLQLTPQEPEDDEAIHFARAVTLEEAFELIPWLRDSDELHSFLDAASTFESHE